MQFIYQKITDLILSKLEQGVVPWQKTWKSATYPKNFVSGLEYKGINLLLLGLLDFESSFWLTFKQCKELGGSIKKDEHSSMVVFWKPVVKINSKPLDDTTADIFFLLRYYHVFNLDQCVLPEEVLKKRSAMPTNPKIIKAEQIIEGYKDRPEISTNNMIQAPRYFPTLDRIEIQSIDAYNTSDDYYAALFHECAHSTGAEKRLARKGITEQIKFGSENYSIEELISEISAAMLSNISGLERTLDNSASYIASWLEVLRNDKRMIVIAASQAQKATDYILGTNSTNQTEEN